MKITYSTSKINSFGGINFADSIIGNTQVFDTIDQFIGNRGVRAQYRYSDLFRSYLLMTLCGGECWIIPASPEYPTYTEWIKKSKSRPSVELGKKLAITTDQFDLIVDYQVMEHEQDRDIVIALADRLLSRYKIESWSFDKGYWGKENKQLLQLEVSKVIMPKLGKRNKQEEAEETSRTFKRLKNKHSAIESNINELENRGLDICPDRGYTHFKNYISLGVCAYNLKKMGAKILEEEREKLKGPGHFRKAA